MGCFWVVRPWVCSPGSGMGVILPPPFGNRKGQLVVKKFDADWSTFPATSVTQKFRGTTEGLCPMPGVPG